MIAPPVQVVAGLLRRNGRLLLCHRRPDRAHYPNAWDLPGGHVEQGESTIEALVRELAEELGVRPYPADEAPWRTLAVDGLELHIYLVDRWSDDPHNVARDEHDEIAWVTADELRQLDLAHASYLELLTLALNL